MCMLLVVIQAVSRLDSLNFRCFLSSELGWLLLSCAFYPGLPNIRGMGPIPLIVWGGALAHEGESPLQGCPHPKIFEFPPWIFRFPPNQDMSTHFSSSDKKFVCLHNLITAFCKFSTTHPTKMNQLILNYHFNLFRFKEIIFSI